MEWLLSSICILTEVNCEDEDNLFFFLTRIEDARIPNSVSPGFRNIALEFFDISPKVRFILELWIHVYLLTFFE